MQTVNEQREDKSTSPKTILGDLIAVCADAEDDCDIYEIFLRCD